MNEHEFAHLLGGIDPELVARAEAPLPMHKKPYFKRALITGIAALLAMATLLGVAAIALIPKTYDLDYEIPKHEYTKQIAQIYYTEDGKIKRESVLLPLTEQNVFMTWQHLNEVGDEVDILSYEVKEEPTANVPAGEETLWELLRQRLMPAKPQKTVTVALSSQITSYENYDALIESLQKTFAEYAGIDTEQVRILINGEQCGIVGLQFWHNLQGEQIVAVAGSTLEITVGMTNVSNKDITFTGSWSAFVPNAVLTMDGANAILHEDYPMTEEYQTYVLAPGESREITYAFPIPENAATGTYDLFVTFGEQIMEFAQAVKVVYFTGFIDESLSSAYEEFLAAYGLNTTDHAAFKSAVQALSHNGVRLFDIMSEAEVSWMPGYSGEMYDSEHFTYAYSALSSDGVIQSHKNMLTATALPDGMTLPFGISTEEGLAEALCKLGTTEQGAQTVLEQRLPFFLTDSIYSSIFTVTVTFDTTYAEISYEYGMHRVDICYDADGQTFEMLRIQTEHKSAAQDGLIGYPINFYFNPDAIVEVDSPHDDIAHYATLSEPHRDQIIAILNGGAWQPSSSDMQHYDYTFTILNPNASAPQTLHYSSEAGIFLLDNLYLHISNDDANTVNEIFAGYTVQVPSS